MLENSNNNDSVESIKSIKMHVLEKVCVLCKRPKHSFIIVANMVHVFGFSQDKRISELLALQ
jgi:hypothetical protein